MINIIFSIVFPLVIVGIIILLFVKAFSNKKSIPELMNLDEFIKDWLKDHGQAHKLDEQYEKMSKDPAGKIYMPITYKGAKRFMKWGFTPNLVSIMNLLLSFLIFYGVIMAGEGHSLDLFSQQPFYGLWLLPIALLVLWTGIIDGIDGAIARLLNQQSRSGGWFDNVIDRVSDVLMLVCLIPGGFLVYSSELDFTWMIWTNVILIFIYEYMRARHEGLGLKETKPSVGERITRILVTGTFFLIYGISSFAVYLTYLIDPSATSIWAVSHTGVITWIMLIFQISLLLIMVLSCVQLGNYSWKQLKKMDMDDGVWEKK